ncbi:MAG: DUF6259 domain-containing protein [Armatimonadota bacterium]
MRIATIVGALIVTCGTLMAQVLPGPMEPGEWEVGWVEDFDAAESWYPVAYTHNSARDFSLTVEEGVAHFRVGEAGKAMRWMTTPAGVNLDTYRTLEMRYRAVGQVDEGDAYFLWMQTNPAAARPDEPPVRLGEISADGEWHVLRKEMPRTREGDVWALKFVLSVQSTDRPADLWIDYIKLMDFVPYVIRAASKLAPQIAVRHDFDDLRDWRCLRDVPFAGAARMSARNGAAQFEVEGMQRNASFVWTFPRPVDASAGANTVVFRYRIRGQRQIYTRNPRTLPYFMTVGAGETEEPVCLWNSLVHDGAWHVGGNSFPVASFPEGVEHVRINLVSEESPGAWAELDWIYLGSHHLPSFSDGFEETRPPASPPGCEFRYADIQPTPRMSSALLLQQFHDLDVAPEGELALDGVPLRLDGGAHVLGVLARDELTIPVGGAMSAVYALIATRPEGVDSFTSWGGPIRAVEEPERFVMRIDYADGSSFEALPVNIAGGSYVMPPGPGLFGLANAHPEREVTDISLVDRTRAVGFHVLAVTVQTAGEPLFETPAAGRPLPPPTRVTDRAPADATAIEVADGRLTMRSDYLTLSLDLSKGICVAGMWSGVFEQDLMPMGSLFALETEGGTVSAEQVAVTDVRRRTPTQATIDFTAHEPVPVRGTLTLSWHSASEIGLSVALGNAGEAPLRGSLTVTGLPGVVIDTIPENVWLFYPGFGTLISNEPFYEDSVKSDHLPLGLVAAWSPARGGGLYLMGRDNVPERDAHYVLEKYLSRVTAAVRYLYLDVAPGETATLPEVAIGACPGDYREALAAYRRWMDTWYAPTAAHPEWFRRIGSFIGITPTLSMFLDADGRMDLSPHIDAMARRLGPIDYLHIYGWFASREHGDQGDYSHYELLGGEEAWRGALAALEARGVRTGLYLDPLLVDERAEIGKRAEEWKIIGADGAVTGWSSGIFYTCAAVPECRRYWAETSGRVARTFPVSGLSMDQVGFWNPASWVCYNPAHGHPTPVGMRVAQAPLVREIRAALNTVDPGCVNYSEFVPTEIMTQWQDGAFTHNHRFEGERPSTFLVNPIYWAVPEVKCFELYAGNGNIIWENVRLPLRALWGRETLYLAGEPTEYAPETAAAIRRVNEIWHRYPEAFATTAPEFLVPTLQRGLYANRFPADGYEVYTLFNDLPHTAEGPAIEIAHREGASYREAWEDVPLQPQIAEGRARIALTIPPKKLCVIVVRWR